MDLGRKLLSESTIFSKYARYLPEAKRRENWDEIVDRQVEMYLARYPNLRKEIEQNFQYMRDKRIVGSMRMSQFAGDPILLGPTRAYNCSFVKIDDHRAFREALFLLLNGTGVGYSVQNHHVKHLPVVRKPITSQRWKIGDSIEGWADALHQLIKAYMCGGRRPLFDYNDIRPKGSPINKTGGAAPGPDGLRESLENVERVLAGAYDRKLTSLEVHDVICYASEAVLSGGIRRSAAICLFDWDDELMLTCKDPENFSYSGKNAQRARANNSAIRLRSKTSDKEMYKFWSEVLDRDSGEPGLSLTNNKEWGYNPSLRAGTRVWTKEFGMIPIEELEGKRFTVKNLDGSLSEAKCWMSSPKETLWKITFKSNVEYYCTAQHEWPVLTKGGNVVKIRTDQLQAGEHLPRLGPQESVAPDNSRGTYDEGRMLGFWYGDGHVVVRGDNDKIQFGLTISKTCERKWEYKELSKMCFNGEGTDRGSTVEIATTAQATVDWFAQWGVYGKKVFPEFLFREASDAFIDGFIQGYFDSDGHSNQKCDVLTSTDVESIKAFRDLLGFKGLHHGLSISHKEGYTVGDRYYPKEYDKCSLYRSKNQKTAIKYAKVVSVEKTEIQEPVWDISVKDKTHCFQLANVITGNCHEVSLRSMQFCNLSEVNLASVQSAEELQELTKAAAFIGTLQASFTDFHYLRRGWQTTTEEDALLGVSLTGSAREDLATLGLREAALAAVEENRRVAAIIGINPAARVTTGKPSGTTSAVLGTSSGCHPWYAPYYIRRTQHKWDEPIVRRALATCPEIVVQHQEKHDQVVLEFPVAAPETAVTTNSEGGIAFLERVKYLFTEWIQPGHVSGDNTNNISATCSYLQEEKEDIARWLTDNRDYYNGITVLPKYQGTYSQAPFEEISREEYERRALVLPESLGLDKVIEDKDTTELRDTVACAGGACEIV